MTIRKAAAILGVAPSTIHRALNEAPSLENNSPSARHGVFNSRTDCALASVTRRLRLLHLYQAMRRLGVSRQTVWQHVKRGELEALYVTRARQKSLRIKSIRTQSELFGHLGWQYEARSIMERISASSFASHSMRNPLVIFRNTAQEHNARSEPLLVGEMSQLVTKMNKCPLVFLTMRWSLTPAACVGVRAMSSSRRASRRAA